ncbi:MAG: AAA family ATPase, partial [Candidatus Delongbacteria bacterium]|nr:AAA family ATPase [Candidatus Delongbacteria bacterium]
MFEILKKYNFWDGKVKGCGFLRKSYLKKMKELDVTKTIITITGGRRVGKSFIVRQYIDFLINENKIKPKQIFYANLFIRELGALKSPKIFTEAVSLWKKKLKVDENIRKYIIIDEVQEIEQWEILINSLYEDFTTEYKLIITGSNSKLLSGELSTYIAGRSFSLNVFPLSYQEYLDFTKKGISKDTFIEY